MDDSDWWVKNASDLIKVVMIGGLVLVIWLVLAPAITRMIAKTADVRIATSVTKYRRAVVNAIVLLALGSGVAVASYKWGASKTKTIESNCGDEEDEIDRLERKLRDHGISP